MRPKHRRDPRHFVWAEPVGLTQLQRASRTVQNEHCFAIGAENVNMLRTVIVAEYLHTEHTKPENSDRGIPDPWLIASEGTRI
jgi:hypothetical protein